MVRLPAIHIYSALFSKRNVLHNVFDNISENNEFGEQKIFPEQCVNDFKTGLHGFTFYNIQMT